MSVRQYTDEFKAEAIKQVVERGFTVVDVAARIGAPQAHAVRLGAGGQEDAGAARQDAGTERFGRDPAAEGRAQAR